MRVLVVTPPAAEPVTPAELREYLRLDGTAEDPLLRVLIAAARGRAEDYTRRSFVTSTLRATLDVPAYRRGVIDLPRPPIRSVTSVAVGTDAALAPSAYVVDADLGTVAPAASEWGSGDRLTVQYAAGYGADPDDVPAELRVAVLRIAATLYEHREDTITGTITAGMPLDAKALLDPYRRVLV